LGYEISIDHDAQLIEIQFYGRSNPQEAIEARLNASLLARDYCIRRVLVGAKRLEGIDGASPQMLFSFASTFRDKPFPTGTKFAVVPSQINPSVNMVCRIARETGTRIHLFNEPRPALEWLFGQIATAELQLPA
jgi:hypothetical protein